MAKTGIFILGMIGTTAFLNRSWKECIFKREDPWNIKATLLALLQWYSNGNLTFAWVNRLKENSEQSVLYFLQLLLAHLPICLWLHRSRAIKIEASRKFIPLFLLLHCNLGTCFPPRKREFFPLGLANALTERNKEGAWCVEGPGHVTIQAHFLSFAVYCQYDK